MPASRQLLALFVSKARGTCTGSCICNWLCGLRLWHIYNDVPWFGDDKRLALLKKLSVKAGLSFSQPACSPVTPAHLCAFLAALDPETPYGAAMGSLALAAFGGCGPAQRSQVRPETRHMPRHLHLGPRRQQSRRV
jgi:hypothetical protein